MFFIKKIINPSLLILVLSINFSLKSLDALGKFFDPEDIRATAAKNIAIEREARRAARQRLAEEEEVKKRLEIISLFIKGTSYLLYNTIKFGYKIICNTNKTCSKMKQGNPHVLTGCFGFIALNITALVLYLKNREEKKRIKEEQIIAELDRQIKERMRQAQIHNDDDDQPGAPPPSVYTQVHHFYSF